MVVIQVKRIQRMQLFTLQFLLSDGDKYYLIFRPGSIYLKKTTDEGGIPKVKQLCSYKYDYHFRLHYYSITGNIYKIYCLLISCLPDWWKRQG